MSQHNISALFTPAAFPSQLTPQYIRLALLLNGADFPLREINEPLRYLELGLEDGNRVNIHAASLPEWQFWKIGGSLPYILDTQNTAAAA